MTNIFSLTNLWKNNNIGIGVIHVKRQILTYFLWRHFSCSLKFLLFHRNIEYPKRCLWKTLQIFYGSVFVIWLSLWFWPLTYGSMNTKILAGHTDRVKTIPFIECLTTTFLCAHSWLNWVDEDDDEDEVGLKEKPEDTTCTSKILHRNKTRSTGSVDKGLHPNFLPSLAIIGTADRQHRSLFAQFRLHGLGILPL